MSQAIPVEGWSELLLALPEFVLTSAHIDDGELVADVALPRDVHACTRCGVIALHALHDYRSHTVRHLPVAGRACRVRWRKRLLACAEGCGTFVERTPSIAPGADCYDQAPAVEFRDEIAPGATSDCSVVLLLRAAAASSMNLPLMVAMDTGSW